VLKKSPSVISSPSHIFLIVISLGSLLFPYKIFFTDDGGSAERVASLFKEIAVLGQGKRLIFSRFLF
jgi:hypothetical protein